MYGKEQIKGQGWNSLGGTTAGFANQQTQPAREPPLEREVYAENDRLLNNVVALTDLVNSLVDRLRPVLVERPAGVSTAALPEPCCELGRRLRAASDGVQRAREMIAMLLEGLEV